MSLPTHIWINGKVFPTKEARVSPLDHGFLVGDGVFETLVARHGKPFTAIRHWKRLLASCEAMGIAAPNFEQFIAAIRELMEANGMFDARIRVTVTSGDGPLGSDRGHETPIMTVVASALKSWPPTETAVTVAWTRNERGALTGIKSTSYGENVRALADAKARGAGEAILANTRGELCEGTGTNIFVVHDNMVKTPPLESGCLAGVTRALVIEACQQAGIVVREETMPLSILENCQEAFLTSSTRDVHPLAAINGRKLPGETSAMTRRVSQAFHDFIAGKDDP